MHKIKILFISHSSYLFGAETCILALLNGLDKDRFDTTVILPDDGPLKQKLDELDVKSHLLQLEWWVKNEGRLLHSQNEIPLALDKLLRIIEEEQPDIIHSNTSVICWGAIAAAITGIRHIWHIHEILNGHPSLESILPLPLLYEAIDFLSDKVVVVSNSVRGEMSSFVKDEKLQVIHNGVEFHRPANPALFRAELNAAPDQVIAITVTSLQKYKGIDNLLATAAKVVEQDESILFAIAGTGPPEAITSLKEGITRNKLEGRVHYLGYRTDVTEILAGSDIFVLPSGKEAFPLVVLEAMSHGKPVVATDCGGTKEMVVEGETGFVVPVEDPDSLAKSILELCSDRKRAEAMGSAAQELFTNNFTLQHYRDSFTALYEKTLKAEKPQLTSRQTSLLNSFITAYVEYLKTMRVVPKLEQDLNYQKRQFVEANSLLTQKQEALLNSERHRLSETQQHADKVLSLVTLMDKNAQKLSDLETQLDEKREELREELGRAKQLRDQLEATLQQNHVELKNRDERIRDVEQQLGNSQSLCNGMAARLQGAEEALLTTEEQRNELQKQLKQKTIELKDRDERAKQVEEVILQECQRVQEQMHANKRQLVDVETARVELETHLKHKTVEIAEQRQRNQQIAEEVAQQSLLVNESLQLKQETIDKMGELLQNMSYKLKGAEEELACLRNENTAYQQLINEKEQRVEDLLNSLSWRITGPLRKTYELVLGKK